MSKYVLKRILLMIPILIGVAIMIFTLMFFVPGDPVEIILGNAATEAQVTAVRAQLGLNQPYIVRLGSFLKELFFHGSFGNSYIYGTDVGAELMTRFPKTLAIAAFSILLSTVIGIPLGIRAATHANKAEDPHLDVPLDDRRLDAQLLAGPDAGAALLAQPGPAALQRRQGLAVLHPAHSGKRPGRHCRHRPPHPLEHARGHPRRLCHHRRAKGVSEHNVIYKHALPNAPIPSSPSAAAVSAASWAAPWSSRPSSPSPASAPT